MSVIFQLFSAEDLKKLSAVQLDDLKSYVVYVMNNEQSVIDEIGSRARDVFAQLTEPLPGELPKAQAPLPAPLPSRELEGVLLKIFDEAQLRDLSGEQIEILKWAIICEMTHSKAALEAIKALVYERFKGYHKGDPQGSDAFYQHLIL